MVSEYTDRVFHRQAIWYWLKAEALTKKGHFKKLYVTVQPGNPEPSSTLALLDTRNAAEETGFAMLPRVRYHARIVSILGLVFFRQRTDRFPQLREKRLARSRFELRSRHTLQRQHLRPDDPERQTHVRVAPLEERFIVVE